MVDFVNKLDFNHHRYLTIGTVRDESYTGKFLFPMKKIVSFKTDCKSIYFTSTIFIKDKIDEVRVP